MKVLLVGANGYGARFLEPIYDLHKSGRTTFEGIVTRSAFPMQEELQAAGIPAYKTLDAFYAEHSADLVVISTPSFLHREQSIFCVEHGSNVLCEKPAAPTVEEVEAMLQAEKDTGKFIAIGYQRCFSPAVLALKKDILDGVLGKPLSAKTHMSSSRKYEYYGRGGGYAGNVATKDGRIVLDSPVANACAHYVQEMLFLLGEDMDVAAEPTLVQGECYRANDITNFDTCCLKLSVRGDIPLYFAASHANDVKSPLSSHYEFEKATMDVIGSEIVVTFKDGTQKNYGAVTRNDATQYTTKIIHCVEAIENGTMPVCTVKTALPHVKLIGAIYKNIPVVNFPEEEKVYDEERLYVAGLTDKLVAAFERGCMLSEV